MEVKLYIFKIFAQVEVSGQFQAAAAVRLGANLDMEETLHYFWDSKLRH